MNGHRRIGGAALATLLGVGLLPATAVAQRGDGFLFGPPQFTLVLHGGWAHANAESQIFDFVIGQHTLERNDFSSPVGGVSASLRLSDHLDLTAGAMISRSRHRSEFREFIGSDDLPIEQETEFVRVPLTLSLKAYVLPRGTRISRLSWIPGRWTPYVGVGGGVTAYQFRQEGEFVEFETDDIFFDEFRDDGAAPTLHAMAGADITLTTTLFLNLEGRYTWARAEMGRDYVGFDDIDLSGFQATVGLGFRR